MANEAKREAIKKYFKPFPKRAILFILIGILLILGGSQGSGGVVVSGIAILGIGVLSIWRASGKPSDQEMDEYISEDLSLAKSKSLQKASIHESELVGDSVVVTGPRFWNTAGAAILYKKGKDGRLRFTPINVSVLHMTQNQIVSYQACLDLNNRQFSE